jgi:hypothetical protein
MFLALLGNVYSLRKSSKLLTGFTFRRFEIKFRTSKGIVKEGGDHMREEGLFYDWQRRGFLHLYSDNGKLIVDQEPCRHEHTQMVVFAA